MSARTDRLEFWKQIAQIGSAVAIPVILALIGYFVQSSLADAGLKKDYVQMALGVLKEQPTKENEQLREWAIAVLDKNSPVAIPTKLKSQLLESTVPFVLLSDLGEFKPVEKIECRAVPSVEVLDWLVANEPSRYTRCANGQVGIRSLDFGKLFKGPNEAAPPTR